MQNVLQNLKNACLQNPYPSAEQRIHWIDQCIALLVNNQQALCNAAAEDFGCRAEIVTQMNDILPSLMALKHAKQNIKKWMQPQKRKTPTPMAIAGGKSQVIYQPKGVVGVMTPWNMPINVVFSPLADVFAAGNRVMIKVSEHAPATAALLEKLFTEYFNNDEALLITGDEAISQQFSALNFDHLIFTGSSAVGKKVMAQAAQNLTPVTLELGGKSPVIISQRVDLDKCVEKLLLGKLLNAGQVCITADYCFVHESQLSNFVETCQATINRLFPAGVNSPDYVSIINERHINRLKNLIDEVKNGSTTVCLDSNENPWEAIHLRKFPCHLVVNPPQDSKLLCEEIFGPVLPIISYRDIDECIAFINQNERPLALYYFGNDKTEQALISQNTHAGGMTVNDIAVHFACDDLPFGGVGTSGMGQLHGFDGFKSVSHAKGIYTQGWLNLTKLSGLLPPYSDKAKTLIKNMLKS